MRDHEFEWDDKKAERNFRDHGVTFEVARLAFDDPDSINREDPDPDEERYSRLCRLDHRVFVVVWTQRGDRVRIISARSAKKHEQQAYFQQEA
ncbi:MAG TPA: BrnT family toxin [Hyphomicrobiaceae bacterium]|jgi:uncharacterized DUF497 family protein|nr:BrnT family toxin [Hyphomicrobiaceae bacterium]